MRSVQHARPCPFCGGATAKPAFPWGNRYGGIDFRYLRCSACATRFIDPVPGASLQAAIFAPRTYHAAFYEEVDHTEYGATAARIAARLPQSARVLDYGCGNGHLLTALAEAGLDPTGVEISEDAAANARKRTGHPVYAADSREWRRAPYDCIHLRDVIGHLSEPVATLNGLLGSLRPGGKLFVEGAIEANASLVGMAARTFASLKRVLSGAAVSSFPPFDLNFPTGASQRALFRRLKAPLVELEWQIHETGWPYRANGKLRNAIALAAIGASRLPLVGRHLGNRFSAVLQLAPLAERPRDHIALRPPQ